MLLQLLMTFSRSGLKSSCTGLSSRTNNASIRLPLLSVALVSCQWYWTRLLLPVAGAVLVGAADVVVVAGAGLVVSGACAQAARASGSKSRRYFTSYLH